MFFAAFHNLKHIETPVSEKDSLSENLTFRYGPEWIF